MRAEVKNGRLVLDEPTDFPEGTVVGLVADPFETLSEQDRARLNESIDRGLAQARTGAFQAANEFLDEL